MGMPNVISIQRGWIAVLEELESLAKRVKALEKALEKAEKKAKK